MRTHHRELRKNRARCSATIDIAIVLLADRTRRGLVGEDRAIISELTGSERQRQGVNGRDGDEERDDLRGEKAGGVSDRGARAVERGYVLRR